MAKIHPYIHFRKFSLGLTVVIFTAITLINSACVDNEIEGASATPQKFAASKATSSFSTLNTCGGSTVGTTFSVRIDIAGTEMVNFASGRYKFSSQSSYTELSSYTYVQTGGSSSTTTEFRKPVKAGASANYITITHCVRFGTSSTIEYVYDLISVNGNESTISLVINRPLNAN
jgi:hypothetical protein